jgi:signal transduction histidine kinase
MRASVGSIFVRWLLPLAAVAVAVILRIVLRDALDGLPPFLLFFAAVMASAAVGGFGPGILATALAALSISFFLIPPYNQFALPTRGETIELFMFALEGLVISALSGVLHAAVARARASERAARELERRVLEVGDAERRRLGHDLHDGLGQQLLGAAFMAKTLQTKLSPASPDHSAYAGEIATTINGALNFARDLARSLSSQTLCRDDLPAALADLALSTQKMFGVACEFHHDADLRPPAGDSAEHLYRLAQEAVNNAVRHGRASHIDIIWHARPQRQVLRIRDNGRGFEPAPTVEREKSAGIGLHVMQHRAAMVGGALHIGRGAGGGTVVACEF